MTENSTEFIRIEHEILDFWEKNNTFNKLKKQNEGNTPFRFIDGPMTANNAMGIHHAWGRTVKDIFIRYHAMKGHDCRYQNGFDSQGLWVEVEVEKQLGFKTKKDIEAYGLDKFTKACKDRVSHYSKIITEQSKRLGQWMDWDNSYFTNTDENIQGIWHFLKKCDDMGLIEKEYKPMPWCPRCGTSLSEHEMTGSYKNITHTSVYFKLPLVERDEKMLVWTTTPWTLAANVGLAVNPEIDYVRAKVKSDDKVIILAKNAIKHLGNDKLEILNVFKGEELIGLHFETCFPDLKAQSGIEHKVVSWDEVSADEGTGIVHIAGGCGVGDYELSQKEGLALIMPVDDAGIYLDGFGFLTGKPCEDVRDEIFEILEKNNKLYKTEPITHSYPVCWRCKHEVLYRLVPAWYIRTAPLKEKLIEAAKSVKWEPESGLKRMTDWLTNMGDWNISRKRFYGMPLPFYTCTECGKTTVVGSKEELKSLAVNPDEVDALPELHRPWVDNIKIKCPHCSHKVSRVAEIGDVWLDAGIVPFSTLNYRTDKDYWEKYFPADWITEMHEQIRLWFYSLLFMSVVITGKAPYKRVLTNSAVVSEDGSKFHKTGFMIKFDEAAEKIGSDTIRYLYASAPVQNDVRFGYNLGDDARKKLLSFWNIYTFFMTYASIDKPDLSTFKPNLSDLTPVDKWLIIRTNEFVKKAKNYLDDYKVYLLTKDFETFTDDVSNWYIRVNRRRFWKTGDQRDKMTAYYALYYALKNLTLVMSPVIPFMTEKIWQEAIRTSETSEMESVHLKRFPEELFELDDNDKLIERTALARDAISTAMRLRNEQQIKVRQALNKIFICSDQDTAKKISLFDKYILSELNIKQIEYIDDMSIIEDTYLTVNFKNAGKVLKGDVNKLKDFLAKKTDNEMKILSEKIINGGTIKTDFFPEELDAELFVINKKAKPGIVSSDFNNNNCFVSLDTVITEELKKEGAVRDIIRSCQVLRKDAGYSVDQRVLMSIETSDEFISKAVSEKLSEIKNELLADDIVLNNTFEDIDKQNIAEVLGTEVCLKVKKA